LAQADQPRRLLRVRPSRHRAPPFGAMDTLGLEDDVNDSMLLEPPDPVDILIAHTDDSTAHRPRPLDFVRQKFQDMKKSNKALRQRVLDLEQTLSIVQTAQEWASGKGMTPEQQERMREIKALLEQAKKAKEEMTKFSDSGRPALYEKLVAAKNQLRREKEEKRQMKERLMHAFDHARALREEHRVISQQRLIEQEQWQSRIKEMKERHRRELRRLQGDPAAMESDRHDQLSHFGEQVIGELTALQQHLHEVRKETVSSVILEGDDLEDDIAGQTGGTAADDGADLADNAADDDAGDGADDLRGGFGDGMGPATGADYDDDFF